MQGKISEGIINPSLYSNISVLHENVEYIKLCKQVQTGRDIFKGYSELRMIFNVNYYRFIL